MPGKHTPDAGPVDLPTWLNKVTALNGPESADLQPWHIVVSNDQFDEDGDNIHSGVYEEYWAGVKKFKRIYKSDDFNQADYGIDKGLYRQGDQKWPSRTQIQIRDEVIAPLYYGATLQKGFHARNLERTFSGYTFQCVAIERNSGISDPTQYCFEPGSSVLRYNRGWGLGPDGVQQYRVVSRAQRRARSGRHGQRASLPRVAGENHRNACACR
jgi:hypothetical protein